MNSKTITQLLSDLGTTPDQVASTLQEQGIKGFVGNPFYCPVAKYLTQKGVHNCGVAPFTITYDISKWFPFSRKVYVPEVVKDFVIAFDGGSYPTLGTPIGNSNHE